MREVYLVRCHKDQKMPVFITSNVLIQSVPHCLIIFLFNSRITVCTYENHYCTHGSAGLLPASDKLETGTDFPGQNAVVSQALQ